MDKYGIATRMVKSKIDYAEKTLVQFKAEFEDDPRYAFEWADTAFLAAARVSAGKRILAFFAEERFEEIVLDLRTQVLRGAMNSTNKSTSVSTNLMDDCKLQAAADYLELLEGCSDE